MLKKILFILLLATSLISAQAQDKELLIGEWVFKEMYNKDRIDPESLAQIQAQLGNKMKIEFIDDKNYEAYFMGKHIEGNWDVLKKIVGFVLKTPEGSFKIEILKLTKGELGLRFGAGEFLMMRK